MKRNTLYIIGIVFLVSIAAAYAFAHGPGRSWDRGYGHMMGPDGWGPGWHHNGGHGYNPEKYYGNLSADETAKLDQQRSEFFKATENIRQKLNEKELALRNELEKDDMDTNKASKLQSEISRLQSILDQERLNFEIKARKSVPNYNRGYGGYGMMMGYGPRGGEYCNW